MKGEEQHQHQYGTFNPSAPPLPSSPPVTGFPQPTPPPGAYHYGQGYQSVPIVAEGRPVQIPRRHHDRLPCCGIGLGWFLFIIGFFLAAVPWYVGALLLLCSRVDYREKPGYVACTVAAVLSAIAIVFGVTNGADVW